MDTFSIIRKAVADQAADLSKVGVDPRTAHVGRITAAVQSVVDVLTPPQGGRYIVGFADISTAATSLGEHRIIVSSKPLKDSTLNMVEQAVVIATFAAHEIGHTIITAPRKEMIEAHNPKSGFHAVTNLADDIILEPWMVDRFPILADAFEFTGLWVLRSTAPSLPKVVKMTKAMTTAERFNAILSATRYDDTTDIVWDGAAAEAERDWGRDWKRRLIEARVRDHATFLALCDEMWERIRTEADEDEPVEQPPIIDCPIGPSNEKPPEGGEEPPVDGPKPPVNDGGEEPPTDGPDEGGDEPPVDGPTQPTDKPGEGGEQPSDKPADPNDQPRDWDDDKPGDEPGEEPTDEPGKEQGEDGKEQGEQPSTDTDGPSEDKPDPDRDGPENPDGEGGGGNSEATSRDEDSLDPDEIDKSTHDQAERHEWDADDTEAAVRTYASTTVTSFGRHGSISTRWD